MLIDPSKIGTSFLKLFAIKFAILAVVFALLNVL